MSNMKRMTYEDLYFYCKDKNPDKEVELFEKLIGDPFFGTRYLHMGLFLDKETGDVYIEQAPVKSITYCNGRE